ncbi:MAG TPA: alpha-E domain-containing protein, partial [Opitutaceae bacterium]|nr:alpha-E domain-containing protein [Opitutaceae bacterium]
MPLPLFSSRPQATVMLSRVAHSLYWMSRYIERAENLARLVDVNLQFLIDFQGRADGFAGEHWGSILASTGDEALFNSLYETVNSQTVTDFLAFDPS